MAFEAFCIVEIMGHQVIAGKVSEETHFGAPLMRVDVPKSSKREGFTCYYGGGSIYKITPTTEEIVQAFVEKQDPEPIKPYMLALPTMASHVQELDDIPDEPDGWGDEDDEFEDQSESHKPPRIVTKMSKDIYIHDENGKLIAHIGENAPPVQKNNDSVDNQS